MIDKFVAIDRVQMPLGKRHAHRGRQPLPQRPGGGFHPRQFEILRMPGTRTAELPDAAAFIDRRMRITRAMQSRIDEHPTVARKIGRASGRERVWQSVLLSWVA